MKKHTQTHTMRVCSCAEGGAGGDVGKHDSKWMHMSKLRMRHTPARHVFIALREAADRGNGQNL